MSSSVIPKGYKHLPVSAAVTVAMIVIPLAGSIFDAKPYFLLAYEPFLNEWRQYWRLLIFQTQFQNESQMALGVVLFTWNYKALERVFGSYKFCKLLLLLYFYNILFITLVIFCAYSFAGVNLYIPSGPFGILFGLLYPYYEYVPSIYNFELNFGGLGKGTDKYKLTFSRNFASNIIALQFLFSEGLVSSPVACLIGYFVSMLLFNDLLPFLDTDLPLLRRLWSHYFKKEHERRQPTVDDEVRNRMAEQETGRAANPADRSDDDDTEVPEDQDAPPRSLGTQLLDTFRR